MSTEQPLVFTINGNVPADTLDYHHEWDVRPEVIKFREFYTDKATGLVVRDSSHVYLPQGTQAGAAAGGL